MRWVLPIVIFSAAARCAWAQEQLRDIKPPVDFGPGWGLVAAVFVDAGNGFNTFGDPLEYSLGIGLRYRLPFLSVGLDVAQSVSESGRNPRLHINFTPEF